MRYYTLPDPRQTDILINQLAEHLSRELKLNECAEKMHITPGSAAVLFCQLCARYGERAQ